MKQVLFIAYYFPPHGGGGVQRSAKFVKYLPEFGWIPWVLCGPPPRKGVSDPTLGHDLPAGTTVEAAHGVELPDWLPWTARQSITRWVLTVDEHIGWFPSAVKLGRRLLDSGEFAAIFSTSAPYTDHLVARRLCKESGLPWVADFRDPWLDNFSARFATRWHRRLCGNIERSILRESSRVVVVSEPMKTQMVRNHSSEAGSHIEVIANGFDRADYEDNEPKGNDQEMFVLTYTGSLYGEQQSGRYFLAAMRRLIDDGQIKSGQFMLRLIGSTGKEAQRLVTEWQLDRYVEFMGYVSHGEAISYQLGGDALLLIIGAGPESGAVLTGKIFEYLATSKPILALVPPGAAADLVDEARAGITVDPEDIGAIADSLMKLYSAWRRGGASFAPKAHVVARYDRRRLTGRLAGVLDEVCS